MKLFSIKNTSNFTINLPYFDIAGNKRIIKIDKGTTTVVRMLYESPRLIQYRDKGMVKYWIVGNAGGATKSPAVKTRKNTTDTSPFPYVGNPNKTLGILIANWNNAKLTDDILRDLKQQLDKSFSVTVVDQNSKERGTKDYINLWSKITDFPITIIKNESNEDLNRVWDRYCQDCPYDFICFLNNDVRVGHFFTHDIRLALSNKEIGCVIHPTNKIDKSKSLCEPSMEILRSPRYQGWDFSIKKECYRKIPDQLRIFGGDNFLFAQIIEQGYKVALANSSPIIHLKERTRVKNSDIGTIYKSDGEYWAKIAKEGGFMNVPSTIPDISEKYPPKEMRLKMNDNVIYTAIIDNYDRLPEVECGKVLGWDFVCFTDSDILPRYAKGWRIVNIPKVDGGVIEKSKMARYYKLNYFEHLSRYKICLWLDCRVDIVQHPSKYLPLLNNQDIIFAKNLHRGFDREIGKILEDKTETEEMIDIVKERYQEIGFDPNKYHTLASGVILFKNKPVVQKFFKSWWTEVEQYSHRDQLSVSYAIDQNKDLKYGLLDFNTVFSKYFKLRRRTKKRKTVHE